MPASIRLDDWREWIEERIAQRVPYKTIREELEASTGLHVGQSTLARYLAKWNVRTNARRSTRDIELRVRVAFTFHMLRLEDKDACTLLRAEGFDIKEQTYARIRKELGLYKRLPPEAWEAAEAEITTILQQELVNTVVESYGQGNLYTYLRSKYNIISRDRVHKISKLLNPQGIENRLNRARAHRGAVITPGPMYSWSMDAYCKYEFVGIQIYAAIDVFSRYIMWIYVGITGRSAVSVLAQYVATLGNLGVVPQKIRSDRGAETTMAADAHYMMSQAVRGPLVYGPEPPPTANQVLGAQEQAEQPVLAPLSFTDCYKFGTSKQNQRIETWWNQQGKALIAWREFFDHLASTGLYNSDVLADRITFLAVFLPILRNAAMEFVHVWNHHRIRRQNKRPNSVEGTPWVLFHNPEMSGHEHCGYPVHEETLSQLASTLYDFGALYSLSSAACRIF